MGVGLPMHTAKTLEVESWECAFVTIRAAFERVAIKPYGLQYLLYYRRNRCHSSHSEVSGLVLILRSDAELTTPEVHNCVSRVRHL